MAESLYRLFRIEVHLWRFDQKEFCGMAESLYNLDIIQNRGTSIYGDLAGPVKTLVKELLCFCRILA